MEFAHVSVLKNEAVSALAVKKGGLYVDMTLGGGGHSEEILKAGGRLIGVDRDANAIEAAGKRLSGINNNFTLVKSNFNEIIEVFKQLGEDKADGFLFDLGVSSYQLDNAERGFSYMQDAPLDMRMDADEALSAYDVVNTYSVARLTEIITNYGEERWAKRISEFINNARQEKEIQTTGELVSIIKAAVPKGARMDGPHPAKRTFQAIRIEVNGELAILNKAIIDAVSLLNTGGRIAVISFHSLEDRIVKNTFASLVKGCECPKEFPVCVCGKKPMLKLAERKPVLPSERELEQNPRARSAKLRIAERLGD